MQDKRKSEQAIAAIRTLDLQSMQMQQQAEDELRAAAEAQGLGNVPHNV